MSDRNPTNADYARVLEKTNPYLFEGKHDMAQQCEQAFANTAFDPLAVKHAWERGYEMGAQIMFRRLWPYLPDELTQGDNQ
ncbi:hypothetical protein [Bifidobacterium scardovii]|jgi:hypothetical protein|uniref:hypothetical protein n=1 Tax=Bifidobacterium scardovii TaxID=158787 RepID=UPI000666D8F8|nr:hypothetical protein [Bifidobacterium scardovii]MBS6948515.1 hypothetical protein [Bifidobacterium scardovii]MDU3737529.1 hypothetical protein [Bifidobacterium scardovii]MDU5610257.1 hypothetical protein [Bifidobacterium scardovii]DAO75354.1 MAG TPA: hypothetical protein [Caudoviricetes sp.]